MPQYRILPSAATQTWTPPSRQAAMLSGCPSSWAPISSSSSRLSGSPSSRLPKRRRPLTAQLEHARQGPVHFVRLVGRQLRLPFTDHADFEIGGRLEVHDVDQVERKTQAVEARPQVRAGGRSPNRQHDVPLTPPPAPLLDPESGLAAPLRAGEGQGEGFEPLILA